MPRISHVEAAEQRPGAGLPYTVSLAVPGSVIENTQTLELATAVAGLIARTAAIFCVDEVVVIDDAPHIRCPCWCYLLDILTSWVLACAAILNSKCRSLTGGGRSAGSKACVTLAVAVQSLAV